MFRKIVSELTYSPALAGHLGVYIRHYRTEVSTRQIGIIFIALAVVVQLFATLLPPESANANDPSTFIEGDIVSVDQYLDHYDRNTANLRDLLSSLGIQRIDIETAELATLASETNGFVWSKQNTREAYDNVHFFTTSNTATGVAYFQSLSHDLMQTEAYIGTSPQIGRFAITKNGAGLITEKAPSSGCDAWPSSQESPIEVNSWFNSSSHNCQSILSTSLSGHEIASDRSELGRLDASDRVAYTISIQNNAQNMISVIPSINIEDVLEYSRILDYGGGDYDFDVKNLTWPAATIESGTEIERTFIVQLLPTIPSTATGEYVTTSYDCEITLMFGSMLSNPVNCPFTKQIERVAHSFPSISPLSAVLGSFVLVSISIFMYFRSKQLLTELYIIRHNHIGGL